MTFSIVAVDPETGDLGVAVASKFLAVGSVVPWARAGVGAVATQAWANVSYGADGLDLLASGVEPTAAIERLTGADEGRIHRQLGMVDATGRSATYTGSGCFPWAGGRAVDGLAAQGNILAGPQVVDALVDTYPRERRHPHGPAAGRAPRRGPGRRRCPRPRVGRRPDRPRRRGLQRRQRPLDRPPRRRPPRSGAGARPALRRVAAALGAAGPGRPRAHRRRAGGRAPDPPRQGRLGTRPRGRRRGRHPGRDRGVAPRRRAAPGHGRVDDRVGRRAARLDGLREPRGAGRRDGLDRPAGAPRATDGDR